MLNKQFDIFTIVSELGMIPGLSSANDIPISDIEDPGR